MRVLCEFCVVFVLTEGHVDHFCVHFCLHTVLFMRQNLVVRKTCRTFALQRAEMPFVDVPWCNGSTRVFGSLSPRSNRSGTTSPSPRVLQSFPACKALFPQQCLYDTAFFVYVRKGRWVRTRWYITMGCLLPQKKSAFALPFS